MSCSARSVVSALTAFSLALGQCLPARAAAVFARADYESCQTADEESFRTAITAITTRALTESLRTVDYAGLVSDEWRRLRLDTVIDKRVDAIVAEVQSETSFTSKIQSLTDSEKAKELAVEVAERVYRSDDVKSAIEDLAAGVGAAAGKHIELASQDAAAPAIQCLKAFLGPRYGSTVAATVAGTAGSEFGLNASGEASVSADAVLRQSGDGMTGAAILIVRRQLANMAARIGQRIVGSILARIVSVVAGGVGLVLIAKDIWELRNGVLPIIAEEMKAKATKDMVRTELAQSLSTQIGEHAAEIGSKSANRMIEIWQEFRRAHAKSLELAGRNDSYRTFLDAVPPETLPRLDEVTSLVLEAEGEAGIAKRLADGTLDQAVRDLPEDAFDIARETRSLEKATKWWALGSGQLGAVVANEIYRRAEPDQFTKASLARLLAVNDPIAIKRLAALSPGDRDMLFERPSAELGTLARSLDENELSTLVRHLSRLGPATRERLLGAVIADASRMQILSSSAVGSALLGSRDQAAALDILLRPEGTGGDSAALLNDFSLAYKGAIDPRILWHAHPMAIAGLGFAALILLMLMRRLLRPRRSAAAAH